MPVRICVAIRERTTEAAVSAAMRASEWADLVEIRADYIRNLDIRRLLREKPCPIIFTLRGRSEGGVFSGPEKNRLEILLRAAEEGADYVDVEFSAFWKAITDRVPGDRVILSYHDFATTPQSLETTLDAMSQTDAGILKVATRARSLSDNLRIAKLLECAKGRRRNVIALAMGREGIPSRILGPYWGSWATFSSLPGGEPTADGQVPADEMVNRYRVRQIGAETRLYGVLGRPLGHSLSPQVHNAAFAEREMNAVYLPLEASGLDDFLEFHQHHPFEGASVTIPFKEEAYQNAHSLSVSAEGTGAVNTLLRKEMGWHGENTDIDGFLGPLRRIRHLARIRAVVLGSGGAARAVVYALRSQAASVCVVARNAAKARGLAARFQADYGRWEELHQMRWDVLVNATPVGMYPQVDESPVPGEWLNGELVYDLVYNPAQTRLLKDAATRGCKTISGVEMFLGQASRQQQLWLGLPGPEDVMRATLEQALAK
jgi:3-dehydroquinate dehydratase / shikimate dehydrogenase